MSQLSINSEAGLEAFMKMASYGFTPKNIARMFGMTVSNVHYHKKKLEEKHNIEFPNVRGQRPKYPLPRILKDGTIGTEEDLLREEAERIKKSYAEAGVTANGFQFANELAYKIIINGTLFSISAAAKEIHINGKDSIEVTF